MGREKKERWIGYRTIESELTYTIGFLLITEEGSSISTSYPDA